MVASACAHVTSWKAVSWFQPVATFTFDLLLVLVQLGDTGAPRSRFLQVGIFFDLWSC